MRDIDRSLQREKRKFKYIDFNFTDSLQQIGLAPNTLIRQKPSLASPVKAVFNCNPGVKSKKEEADEVFLSVPGKYFQTQGLSVIRNLEPRNGYYFIRYPTGAWIPSGQDSNKYIMENDSGWVKHSFIETNLILINDSSYVKKNLGNLGVFSDKFLSRINELLMIKKIKNDEFYNFFLHEKILEWLLDRVRYDITEGELVDVGGVTLDKKRIFELIRTFYFINPTPKRYIQYVFMLGFFKMRSRDYYGAIRDLNSIIGEFKKPEIKKHFESRLDRKFGCFMNLAGLHNALGNCYSEVGNRKFALEHLKSAVEFSNYIIQDYYIDLGLEFLKHNKTQQACLQFSSAFEAGDSDAEDLIKQYCQ